MVVGFRVNKPLHLQSQIMKTDTNWSNPRSN